jgi:AhpD family alkylhydroperoxidase
MAVNFPERHQELQDGFRKLRRADADVMAGFASLHRAAMADGALPARTKELIALAIGITSHCDGCIAFHVHDALEAGATRAEVEEAIGVAILMGGGPAAVYGSDALEALNQFEAV